MRIIKVKSYDEMSLRAAEFFRSQVTLKPDSVLGLATGSTPIGLYSMLAKWHKEDGLDFSKVRSVNLDEYKGLSGDHDQSYRYFMNKELFSKINIKPENTYLPDGTASDDDKECERYDAVIDSLGGVDIQLLGIGRNGHIGFNEPAEGFSKGTNCVKLTESTIDANSRLFDNKEDVPHYAYTMGCGTIMKAKRILLIGNGANKAQAIKEMIEGPVNPKYPASILQLHPDVIVVADEEALSMCRI